MTERASPVSAMRVLVVEDSMDSAETMGELQALLQRSSDSSESGAA